MPTSTQYHPNASSLNAFHKKGQRIRKKGHILKVEKVPPVGGSTHEVHEDESSRTNDNMGSPQHDIETDSRQRKSTEATTFQSSPEKEKVLKRKTSFKLPEKRVSRRVSTLTSISHTHSPELTRKNSTEVSRARLPSQDQEETTAPARRSLDGQDATQPRRGTVVDITTNRRPSIVQGPPSNKLSFRSVSKKVTTLLKFRHVAQPRKPSIAEEQVISPTEIVEDLPKAPRFSSFMSAEAQYALMKGYEDIIAEKLSSKYPEYHGMLKRNKTPHHSIALSDKTGFGVSRFGAFQSRHKAEDTDEDDHDRNKKQQETSSSLDHSIETVARSNDTERDSNAVGTSTMLADVQGSQTNITGNPPLPKRSSSEKTISGGGTVPSPTSPIAKEQPNLSPLQNLRRMSFSFPAKLSKSKDDIENDDPLSKMTSRYGAKDSISRNVQKSTVLPGSSSPLNHERRIILSYRLESAMDLLDTMKPNYEHTLSPRVKVDSRRQVKPVVDFNRWANQWATEFKPDSVK